MKARTRITYAAAIVAGVVLLAGCTTGPSDPSGETPGSLSGLKIAMLDVFPQNPYVQVEEQKIQEMAAEAGISVTIKSVNLGDPQAEVANIQDAATADAFDGYILMPQNGVLLLPAIEALVATGKPVVISSLQASTDLCSYDPPVPGLTGQAAAAPCDIGEAIADGVTAACETVDECHVMNATGLPGFPNEVEVTSAIKEAADAAGATWVETAPTMYDIATAESVLQGALAANPETNVLSLEAPQMYAGFVRAFPDGIPGLKIVVNCPTVEAMEALRAGDVFAVATPNGVPMSDATYAMNILLAALEDPSKIGEWVSIDTIGEIGLPATLFESNRSEWDSFVPEWSVG